jgi:hypothetical protein
MCDKGTYFVAILTCCCAPFSKHWGGFCPSQLQKVGFFFLYSFLCEVYNLNVSVHRDEEVNVPNSPLVIFNALKPRKLDEDDFRCPIAVFEPEDPTKRPMYCKNKVR